MIPASEIDQLILSFGDTRWLKVARIIGKTLEALEQRGVAMGGTVAKQIDARLAVIVRSGKLEAKGNIKRWRYSEVRLPAARQSGQFLKPVLGRRGAEPRKRKRVEAAE